jgi:glutamate dehydrogenase (NAD(P)+)
MKDGNEFLDKLAKLDARFDAHVPEMELKVVDPHTQIEGYVVVWNAGEAEGIPGRYGKGGTRITPNVTIDEVRMLARIMSLKNAAAGLPIGGAKSGLRADPDSADFEEVFRSFVRQVKPVLRENGGIFGGFGYDVGARPQQPRWVCDELGTLGSVTGKPIDLGGTDYDAEGIAGLGVVHAARAACQEYGRPFENASIAVRGLGAMGAAVVRYSLEHGAKLSYISDPKIGGSYRLGDSVSPELLKALSYSDFETTNALLKDHGPKLPLDEILSVDVDIFFPCAIQGDIHEANVADVQARMIVEGANNPLSAAAREELFAREIPVIPDFIANPGGIIAAYVEMISKVTVEENIATKAKVIEAKQLTEKRVFENTCLTIQLAKRYDVTPSQAGRALALSRMYPGLVDL